METFVDDHRQFEPDALEDEQGNQGWIPYMTGQVFFRILLFIYILYII